MATQCFICFSETPPQSLSAFTNSGIVLQRMERLLQTSMTRFSKDGAELCPDCDEKLIQVETVLTEMRETFINTRRIESEIFNLDEDDEKVYHRMQIQTLQTETTGTQTDTIVQKENIPVKSTRVTRQKKTKPELQVVPDSESKPRVGRLRKKLETPSKFQDYQTKSSVSKISESSDLDCTVCGEKMKNGSALRRHQKSHRVKELVTASVKTEVSVADSSVRTRRGRKSLGENLEMAGNNAKESLGYVDEAVTVISNLQDHIYSEARITVVADNVAASADFLTQDTAEISDQENSYSNIEQLQIEDVGPNLESPSKSWKRKTVDGKSPKVKEISKSVIVNIKKKAVGIKCTCEICAKQFANQAVLQRHQFTIHNSAKPHECQICQQKFKWKQSLKAHSIVHTAERPFKCNICPKTFRSAGSLTQHRLAHEGKKLHKCEFCSAEFTRSTRLKIHIRSHTGQLPYVCETCGQAFADPALFKKHGMIHRGERPHKCDYCGKGFLMARYLSEHRKSHTGERKYLCSICGSAFANAGRLKRHMDTHLNDKNYECQICKQAFRHRETLDSHMNTHMGLKPFVCQVCNKAFGHRSSLRQHKIIHSNESRKHKCQICAKEFYTAAKLRRHAGFHARKQQNLVHLEGDIITEESMSIDVLDHEETFGEMVVEIKQSETEAEILETAAVESGNVEISPTNQSLLEVLTQTKIPSASQTVTLPETQMKVQLSEALRAQLTKPNTQYVTVPDENSVQDENTQIVVQTVTEEGETSQSVLPSFCVISPSGVKTEYRIIGGNQNIVYQIQE